MRLFSEPAILAAIGPVRMAKLLEGFREELKAAKVEVPASPDPTCSRLPEPEGSEYFRALARMLSATGRLPGRLLKTLLTLEAAAADEGRLRGIVERRIPCISVNWNCLLDCALELWFAVPEELEPFVPLVKLPTIEGGNAGQQGQGLGDGKENDEQALGRLARLTLAQYDRVRKSEAGKLGMRVESLDAEVSRCRRQLDEEANGGGIELPVVEPWPEAVNGGEVLDAVAGRYSLYVVLPPGAAEAMALWTQHAHALEAFFLWVSQVV